MRLLLDTHLLVWAMGSPERLSAALAALAAMLQDPANKPVFSVASLWELVIKQGLGKPDFLVEPALLRRALLDGGWQELPVQAHHALAVAALPLLHRDPFDHCRSVTGGLSGAGAADGRDGLNQSPHPGAEIALDRKLD